MFNPKNYNNKTINVFEIVGAYTIDVFYNSLYDRAKQYHMDAKFKSVTDAYTSTCSRFLVSLKNQNDYVAIVGNLRNYFSTWNTITSGYIEWVDMITVEFVPEEFFKSLNNNVKDNIIRILIENIFKNFARILLNDAGILGMLIDDHSNKENIPILQNKMLTILMEERKRMFQRFVSSITDPMHSRSAQAKMIIELKKENKLLTKRNEKLEDYFAKVKEFHNESKESIDSRDDQIRQLSEDKRYAISRAQELASEVKTLTVETEILKGRVETMSMNILNTSTKKITKATPIQYKEPSPNQSNESDKSTRDLIETSSARRHDVDDLMNSHINFSELANGSVTNQGLSEFNDDIQSSSGYMIDDKRDDTQSDYDDGIVSDGDVSDDGASDNYPDKSNRNMSAEDELFSTTGGDEMNLGQIFDPSN
jgi:hypothetical protein